MTAPTMTALTTTALTTTGKGPAFVRLGPVGRARVRLLCFPQAGGGTATFRPLSSELPAEIDLLALRLPGRETRRREPPFRRMGDVVAALADELDGYRDLPLAMFGYCAGSYTMFELARHLLRTGRTAPAALFVCASAGPVIINRTRNVHLMPDQEFKAYLNEFRLTPEAILADPNLFGIFEPAIRADFEVYETDPFVPGDPVDIPFSVIGARDDASVAFDELLEWREHTTGPFTLRVLAGGHNFFTTGVSALGGFIANDLAG
jgi:medium-chain acyl-[acyl-carrier-protein] hydrolase